MNSTSPLTITGRVSRLTLATALLCVASGPANAQHLTIPQPGGMPGWPVITNVSRPINGLSVISWDGTPGSSGYFQLVHKRSLKDPSWQAVGAEIGRETGQGS